MKPTLTTALALAGLLAASGSAFAVAGPHPIGNPSVAGYWTEGLRELVDHEKRVGGLFVNAEDTFIYAGDAQALNGFLDKYATLKDARLRVVLHPGTPQKATPVEQPDAASQADWQLYSAPRDWIKHNPAAGVADDDPPLITRLDVWIGRSIKLEHLEIPESVPVEAAKPTEPDGEVDPAIREFIERHQARSRP